MENKRRNFISKIYAAILGSLVPATLSGNASHKVKMLTAEGKVVEVDSTIVKQARGKRTTNKEILDWSGQILNKKSL